MRRGRNLAQVIALSPGLVFQACMACPAWADLRLAEDRSADGVAVCVLDGDRPVFTPIEKGSSLLIVQPSGRTPVVCRESETQDGTLRLTGGAAPGLTVAETYRVITPGLIERAVTVTAVGDQRYYVDLGWSVAQPGEFHSFMGREPATRTYTPTCAGPEFGGGSLQTLPFLGLRTEDTLYGLMGDTPGLWENRCFLQFDVEKRRFGLTTGDGSPRRVITIPRNLDATSVYRTTFDGWQHIEAGQSQTFRTWLFSSPIQSLYDVQLAAHLALANAKAFNHSALEAILRNTSYLLLRRNLLRTESDYLFISGVGYGWKQWVSDGFWTSRGLDDPAYDAQAHAAVFFERINYEDNAQYYLIWSAMVRRAGGDLDERTVGRAYRFIREHERDGLYIPPRLNPDKPILKTYHDQLPYDDDDAPSSNQGFHCGALLAARELGFPVTDADIDRATAGYQRMFNTPGGYMATSLKQQDHVGQDALYGEVLTFAVFGRKLLPDEMVRRHLETSVRIQSPHGMRVISKPDGSLLDGHSGAYVYGGSWFLNDAANYLDGLIHGMDPAWVDDRLLWRLCRELAYMPAFHESLDTARGQPYGHHLYCWNSGFWWLRQEVLKRLAIQPATSLESRLDNELGVVRRGGFLYLEPTSARLRPRE
ncbi:MAG TPA: hypothetical protein PKY77_16450 [Phycisphaerae bacterium]|nr:hypothetical protein [Phycisphaerae bacterium]HRY66969.1 hypothetical protein [Phycisphaerae bacterium]HSA29565.1 hypothetical protein [Phycisphaerae bacterium]